MAKIAKPKLIYLVLCDSVAPDSSGKKSLLGTFDRILTKELPFVFPHFSIVTGWQGYDGDYTMKVEILDPQGKKIFSSPPLGLRFQRPFFRADFIVEMERLKIDCDGIYEVQVYLLGGKTPVSSYKVFVEKVSTNGSGQTS